MRVPSLQATLATLLAAGCVEAQYLINELSFGTAGRINPNHGGTVPNYKTNGEPNPPQILSNRIILTPIVPGNQRGSIWSENVLTYSAWSADFEFRATGPERGSGNLNIWLARNGEEEVGSSSIYTVRKFDGLALVVDTHGGSGGMIRGFLNDNGVDYSQHHSVDELAFGHCLYSYRNLGRPTQIKMKQTAEKFRVEVDNKLCFETDAVSMPRGNKFGITAATPEDNPDSFEIFKVAVMSESAPGSESNNDNNNAARGNNDNTPQHRGDAGRNKQQPPIPDEKLFDDALPDEDADVFQTSKTQFQDLHNRMQATNHQISALYRTLGRVQTATSKNHIELIDQIRALNDRLQVLDQLSGLDKRMSDMEKELRTVRSDLSHKIQANTNNVRGILSDHHATLSQTVIDSLPGHKRMFVYVVGAQVIAAGVYVLYKRRKANSPKKYL